MNKILSIIIVIAIILSICCVSLAEDILVINEDFSIRGGIGYNSTIDDIKKIEEQNDAVVFSSMDDYDTLDVTCIYYSGTVGGFQNSQVTYTLGYTDKQLKEIAYAIDNPKGEDEANRVYNQLVDNIKNKYGEPIYSNENNKTPIVDIEIDKGYSQWVVEYNDCYAVISTIYSENMFKRGEYYNQVLYNLYSKDEMKEIFEQKDKDAQQKDTDF